MAKKTKLELTWIGKDQRPRLEPRVLVEDPARSFHADRKVTDNDQFDNRLIFGDNLLALKALEQEFAGKVKCIYIDPPYNTGSAFEHYDDGLEHSLWLSMIRDRLEQLHRLLSPDGSIWVSIDDNECHYLKVLMDEVFGRTNFIANVIWQKVFSPKSTAKYLSDMHDHILVYAKDRERFSRNLLPRNESHNKAYKNPDNDSRGPWTSGDLSARNPYSAGLYSITTPAGRLIDGPPKGMYWRVSKKKFESLDRDGRIWWGASGDNQPRLKRFLSDVMDGIVPQTMWLHQEVGNTQEAKKEVMAVVPDDATVFQTPKPERLLQRILTIATKEEDWVLDSFAGTGSTGATAHKMGRRWIMCELGEHCHTHIIPRLKKVIDGDDPGGITEETNWQGGGGFRYFTIAPSLLEKDQFDSWIINKKYNAELLTQAICKLEGFTYEPSDTVYWQHGHSTESDFIYVTTQNLTRQQIEALSEDVGPNRSLLVFCSAYRIRNMDEFPNLTLRKIPKAVLSKCEWGKDDYSLEIKNLAPPPEQEPEEPPPPRRNRRKPDSAQKSLFAEEGGDQ